MLKQLFVNIQNPSRNSHQNNNKFDTYNLQLFQKYFFHLYRNYLLFEMFLYKFTYLPTAKPPFPANSRTKKLKFCDLAKPRLINFSTKLLNH